MASLLTEQASNLSIPTFFLQFDGHIPTKDLIALMQSRFMKFERFRSRTEGTTFIEIPDFDVKECCCERELVHPSMLKQFVSSIMNTPMEKNKPLWEAHIIHNVQGANAGEAVDTAIVFRVHHCIAGMF